MRDQRIDLLRFIGLSLIIFAHTSPPSSLFQIRNFDVPLMVILSGVSFSLSGVKSNYFEYVFGRFKRLVLPVWFFLSLFFMCSSFFGFDFEFKTIIGSFLLVGGIGYVWIIKVFFGVAILSPVLMRISGVIKNNVLFFLFIVVLFFASELIRFISLNALHGFHLKFAMLTYLDLIPYSILFLVGVRFLGFTKNQILLGFSLFLFLFVVSGVYYSFLSDWEFISTQNNKYPVGLYYVSYSLLCVFIIWYFIADKNIKISKLIGFIASNTIWIYLWHIPFVFVVNKLYPGKWLSNYLFIYLGALVVAYLQVIFIRYTSNRIKSEYLSKNLKIIFTG